MGAPKQTLVFRVERDTDVEIRIRNVEVVMANCGSCESEVLDLATTRPGLDWVSSQRLASGTWTVRILKRDQDDGYFSIHVLD